MYDRMCVATVSPIRSSRATLTVPETSASSISRLMGFCDPEKREDSRSTVGSPGLAEESRRTTSAVSARARIVGHDHPPVRNPPDQPGGMARKSAGDEGPQRGLAGGGGRGHPLLESSRPRRPVMMAAKARTLPVTAASSGELARMASRLAWSASARSVGPGHDPAGHRAGLRRGRERARASAAFRGNARGSRGRGSSRPGSRGRGVSCHSCGGVGAAGVPPFPQVGLVSSQDAGPAAGAVVDEQLLGAGGAGEPADGVAGQAELGGDSRQAAALGQQLVHVGVPAAGPARRSARCGAAGAAVCRRGCRPRRPAARRCRTAAAQVLAVPGDRPLDGLAEVVPQVPPVRDLDRVRCAAGAAVGVDPGPVPADHLRSRPGCQPGGERVRRPLGRMSTGGGSRRRPAASRNGGPCAARTRPRPAPAAPRSRPGRAGRGSAGAASSG